MCKIISSSSPLLALIICSTISAAPRACSLACWYRIFCFSISFSWEATRTHAHTHILNIHFTVPVLNSLQSGNRHKMFWLAKGTSFSFMFYQEDVFQNDSVPQRSFLSLPPLLPPHPLHSSEDTKGQLSKLIFHECYRNILLTIRTLPLPSCLHTRYTKDLLPSDWKGVRSQCITTCIKNIFYTRCNKRKE